MLRAEMVLTNLNKRGKIVSAVTVLALGAAIFSSKGLNGADVAADALSSAWGATATERPNAAMDREAAAKYELAKQQASPAQLFELRYTESTSLLVGRIARHKSGISGVFEGETLTTYPYRKYKFKDGCLNNTAYDINGGKLNFQVDYDGLFSSVHAGAHVDIPTSVAKASYDSRSSELSINTQQNDLTFNLEGTDLLPANQVTQNVLTAYGCEPDVEYSWQTVRSNGSAREY